MTPPRVWSYWVYRVDDYLEVFQVLPKSWISEEDKKFGRYDPGDIPIRTVWSPCSEEEIADNCSGIGGLDLTDVIFWRQLDKNTLYSIPKEDIPLLALQEGFAE